MPKTQLIRTKTLGERMSEEGVYDIPLHTYHKDCLTAPSVSSSELVTLAESGEEYFVNSKYNPDYEPLEEYKGHKRHFRFGSAAHAKIMLGKDWHKDDFILIPKKWNGKTFRTKDLAEWVWIQEVRKGFIAIFESEVEAVDAMAERIKDDPGANALFNYGVPEVSLCIKVGEIWVKARPDMLPILPVTKAGKVIKDTTALTAATRFAFSATVLSDYKTIDDNSEANCRRAIARWGYDMKLANVALTACRLFGLNFSDLSFGLVFQKHKPPYGITTIEIDPDGDYMHLLVARCLYAAGQFEKGMSIGGEWEGYTAEILRYTPSGFFMDRLRRMVEDGTYPNLDGKLRVIEDGK